jgi:four helix bundle protein
MYADGREQQQTELHGTFDRDAYVRWCATLTRDVTADPLWRMAVYRLSLFLMDLAWDDATRLDRGITRQVAAQLYGAVSSISANIADGYGRQSGRDRARFYEYALCSAREAVVWYRAGRRKLGREVASRRIETLTEIRRLLLVITPAERMNRQRLSGE